MSFLLNPYILSSGDGLPITANLVLHFQADADNTYSDAGVTLAVDGDNIRQINDLSGNSNNLDQATASNQLIFKTDSLTTSGGKYWKGNTTDVMNLTSNVLWDVSVGCTSFMVCKKDALSDYAIGFGLTAAGQDMLYYSDGSVYVGGAPYYFISHTNSTDWTVLAMTQFESGAFQEFRLFADGVYIGNQSHNTQFIVDNNLASAFNRVSPLNRNDVEYAELLHYDAPMSDTNIVTVSDWLKNRHSIT
jgi:hypothetical protein